MGQAGSQLIPGQGEQTVVPPDEPKQEQYVANWYTLCGAENSTMEVDLCIANTSGSGNVELVMLLVLHSSEICIA